MSYYPLLNVKSEIDKEFISDDGEYIFKDFIFTHSEDVVHHESLVNSSQRFVETMTWLEPAYN